MMSDFGNTNLWDGSLTEDQYAETILRGTAVLCAGCGRILGLATVSIEPGYIPNAMPDWPYSEDICTICIEY